MPDSKITALTAITTVNPATFPLVIVDTSDTSMAITGTTKKVTTNQLLGSGGTATLASATITGDLTVATSALKVTSSNGRVGIGTASPANPLHISGTNPVPLLLQKTGSTDVYLSFTDSSGVFGYFGFSNGDLRFQTPGQAYANKYVISSDGTSTWSNVGGVAGTAMTLNSTGLGVGGSPTGKLSLVGTGTYMLTINNTATDARIQLNSAGTEYGQISVGTDVINLVASGANTNMRFLTNGSEKMRLDPSGNVGIGVTPSAWRSTNKALQVGSYSSLTSSSAGDLQLFNNAYINSGGANIYQSNGFATRYEQYQGVHAWYTAPSGTAGNTATFTQAMTLDASGNLLVGTTTNTDVYRTNIQFSGTSVNGLIVKNLASTGGPVLLYLHDSAQTVNTATVSAEYTDSTTQRWRLYKNGGLANYQANNVNLSDVRTKTDIKPLGSYWNKIKSLEVVTFKYKDQTHSDDNIGLIAQQVESVAPELVDADGFGNTPEDGVPLKTIYTTDLYHAAIKALQEAMTRIEALEAKLA